MAAVVFPRGLTAGSAPSGAGLVIERAERQLRLGFTHAVTTEERLLSDALAMARAVSPAAFEAYAFSKRALQAATLERIEAVAARLDDEIPIILSNAAGIRVRAQRFAEIKGHAPPWAPVEAGP